MSISDAARFKLNVVRCETGEFAGGGIGFERRVILSDTDLCLATFPTKRARLELRAGTIGDGVGNDRSFPCDVGTGTQDSETTDDEGSTGDAEVVG
jgi:hypothetical protein